MRIKRSFAIKRVVALVATSLLVFAAACGPEEGANNSNNTANNGDECTPTNGGVEICDDIDNDCNGVVDDDAEDANSYFTDADGDTYGATDSEVRACDPEDLEGDDFVTQGGDCDDDDADINPDATEVCDGVDNNCDGDTDEGDVEPQACQNQIGVCAESATTTCDSGDYAMCTADDYGDEYASRDDEAWMCDGLDNDCDEETDEFCCPSDDAVPPSVSLATAELTGSEHPFDADEPPTHVAASANAPEGAFFASATKSGANEITLQHFDEFGTPVGSAESVSSPDPVNSVALIALDSGYEIIWSTYAEADSGGSTTYTAQINAQARNADLSQDGFPETVLTSDGNVSDAVGYTELEAVAIGDTVAVGYVLYGETFDAGTGAVFQRSAGGLLYDLPDRETTTQELDLQSSDTDANFSNVATAVHDGDFLFTWGEPEQDRLSTRVFADDGTAGTSTDVDLQGNLLDGRVDTVSLSSNEIIVFDSESGVSGPEIVATTITLDSGDVTTDRLAAGVQPSVESIDTNADGFADDVAILWQKTSGTPDLFVRAIAVESLGPDTAAELALGYTIDADSPPAMFQHGVGLGLSWRTAGPSSRDVFYLPFSTSGIGVCQPL